jgi:hypothetical protein
MPSADPRCKAKQPPCPIAIDATDFIPMIVSNCVSPLVIPSGKQAVFHTMDARFLIRKRITPMTIQICVAQWAHSFELESA